MSPSEKGHTMDKFEKAELVCKKCGVTFEEAREALDACNEDVLDAVVWLERAGKSRTGEAAHYSTEANQAYQTSAEMSQAQSDYERSTKKEGGFSAACSRCMGWLRVGLRKTIDTSFVVDRSGKRILSMPTLVLILLAVFAFWITIPLLVIGLFFDFKYRFEGIDEVHIDVNDIMDKAADGAAHLKNDVKGSEPDKQ